MRAIPSLLNPGGDADPVEMMAGCTDNEVRELLAQSMAQEEVMKTEVFKQLQGQMAERISKVSSEHVRLILLGIITGRTRPLDGFDAYERVSREHNARVMKEAESNKKWGDVKVVSVE